MSINSLKTKKWLYCLESRIRSLNAEDKNKDIGKGGQKERSTNRRFAQK
jgi:hypothetical protein